MAAALTAAACLIVACEAVEQIPQPKYADEIALEVATTRPMPVGRSTFEVLLNSTCRLTVVADTPT